MPEYIRVSLGLCNFIHESERKWISCYPIVKLYKTGVLLVSFRIIGHPRRPISARRLIRVYVNLARERFERIEVPPALVRLAPQAFFRRATNQPLWHRHKVRRLERSQEQAVARKTFVQEAGDFDFELCELPSGKDEELSLRSLAQTIGNVIAYAVSKPRGPYAYLILGERKLYQIGSFWLGRPHIHLVRFQDQGLTASENAARFGAEFGWMLARSWGYEKKLGRRYLPASARGFEDYGAYVGQAATLWVWSKSGLAQRSRSFPLGSDANRGRFIYEPQAIIELLEYGYILHRKLLVRASGGTDLAQVLKARRDLLAHVHRMDEASQYGEVRDLLRQGWAAMGIRRVRSRIREALAIRQDEVAAAEARATERERRLLSVFLGLLAVPPVATEVVKPLWSVLKLPAPADKDLAGLMMIVIASIPVVILSLVLIRVGLGSRRRGMP